MKAFLSTPKHSAPSPTFLKSATVQKLNEIGCVLDTVENGGLPEFSFTDEEIEVMAEMEHARWVAERIKGGLLIMLELELITI